MFTDNRYTLYTKDIPIMEFKCERDRYGAPRFIETKRHDAFVALSPYSYNDIETWISNRRAPKHRAHIKELLKKCGCDDLEGFIRFTYCAGLNDTYWVKPHDSEQAWDDVSLYRNEFDETIARIAFGTGLAGEGFSSTTPELATDGTFPKCWKRFAGEIYLLKQGSSGARNAGREPYSEIMAYQIAKHICDNPLPYDLIRFHGELATKCKIFTSESVGYTPALSIIDKNADLPQMLRLFDKLGSGEEFRQMIVLDALTLNTDRHLKNFGILYDNDSMKCLGMAPVFDNNLSMCPFAEIEDLRDMEAYMATRQSAIGDGFNEAAIACMTPDIKERLHALHEFKFTGFECTGQMEKRIPLLEKMVHKQIENLLHQRIIAMPTMADKKVELNAFTATIKADTVPKEMLQAIINGSVKINDFTVTTSSGDVLKITNCKYTSNIYDDCLEIDIYDCKTEGETQSLTAVAIEGLTLSGRKCCCSITAQSIDLQIDKGECTNTSTITDVTFGTEHEICKEEKDAVHDDDERER